MKTIMRALVLDDAALAAVATLKACAEASPVPLDEMRRRAQDFNDGKPVEPFNAYTIDIPDGYVATYTVEEHPPGQIRHLAVGIRTDDPGQRPNLEAVKMLVEAFGFKLPLEETLNTLEPGIAGGLAFNVVEPVDATVEDFIGKRRT